MIIQVRESFVKFYSKWGPLVPISHQTLLLLSICLPPSKCLETILYICSCVCMTRFSVVNQQVGILSATTQVWLLVLKPLIWGMRQKISGFCSSEQEGGSGRVSPLHIVSCNSNQLSRCLERRKCQWNQRFFHSFNKYLFSA